MVKKILYDLIMIFCPIYRREGGSAVEGVTEGLQWGFFMMNTVYCEEDHFCWFCYCSWQVQTLVKTRLYPIANNPWQSQPAPDILGLKQKEIEAAQLWGYKLDADIFAFDCSMPLELYDYLLLHTYSTKGNEWGEKCHEKKNQLIKNNNHYISLLQLFL